MHARVTMLQKECSPRSCPTCGSEQHGSPGVLSGVLSIHLAQPVSRGFMQNGEAPRVLIF